MTKKSEYIGRCCGRYSKADFLFYRYRGKEYMISNENEINGYSETLASQHRKEQHKIDREIEQEQLQLPPVPYGGKVDKALDELFTYWEGENCK